MDDRRTPRRRGLSVFVPRFCSESRDRSSLSLRFLPGSLLLTQFVFVSIVAVDSRGVNILLMVAGKLHVHGGLP